VALARVLEIGPEDIIARVRAAQLRQKGYRGRLLADRWRACLDARADEKCAICNAVDGDPRAPVARYVLGRNPETVVEGLLIAARAIGATRAVVCLNEEYADERAALADVAERSGREISIHGVPASLVTAEETALIRAVENRQPLPYLRPDGDVRGVDDAPTLIEDAETLATVAGLFTGEEMEPREMAKLVFVCGDVTEARTLEVPLGTTLAAALEQAEGRPVAELDVKAVRFGQPAGPFFAGKGLETLIEPAELEKTGATMGAGALEVFAGGRCGVDMAMDAMAYLHEGSCGKCVFCREGSRQLLDILQGISEGRTGQEQMALLREIAEAMGAASICSIGQGAALPVLSALELFADDFQAHLVEKRCPGKTT